MREKGLSEKKGSTQKKNCCKSRETNNCFKKEKDLTGSKKHNRDPKPSQSVFKKGGGALPAEEKLNMEGGGLARK